MPTQLTLSAETLYGFLLVLTRVAATFVFVPLPQLRHSSTTLRIVLSLAFAISPEARGAVLSLGSAVFSAALRLALPVVALLLLVDLTFALFGRLHAQLQLLSLAFPAKMLATLGMLALLSQVFPRAYEGVAARGVAALMRLAGD